MINLVSTIWLLLFSHQLVAQATMQSNAQLDLNKQLLIERAQNWVAEQQQIAAEQVVIVALDRRLKVPNCDRPHRFSFPFTSSQKTLLVECPDNDWRVFIQVKTQAQVEGFVYRRDMQAQEPLRAKDIVKKTIKGPSTGLMQGLENLASGGDSYNLTTAVNAGDAVAKRHLIKSTVVFRLNRSILAGERIRSSDVSAVAVGLSSTAPDQRFPRRLLAQAVAAWDLNAGDRLSRRDFKIKNRAIMSTANLSRGQKLTADNTQLQAFYGNLPKDALLSSQDIVQMEAIRGIRSGQVLRLSDVRPAALINKGDNVTLTVGSGLLTISVTMTALESGKIDQQIALLNPESGETVRGLVTGPGQARGL
jgi:flagella basal body P-ring formation protein FlgA